jgi:UDP-N-acetylglucosamine 4,6-dehydratase/5-epimerase
MKNLIIGGTGTLGTELLRRLTERENDITVFSRDEMKQQALKPEFPGVKWIIGDIRDRAAVDNCLAHGDYDTIFYVAALKHVDVLEENPNEAIKTNILGTVNIAESCLKYRVKNLIFSSTDKAVLPINVYGMSKAVAERYLLNLNKHGITKFSVFRWGNVLGSRGSAIHGFVQQLLAGKPVNITHTDMTRFWITIGDAVTFILRHFEGAPPDKVLVPPMKACKLVTMIEVLADMLGVREFELNVIGIRPGEKIHECLESNHDYCVRSDTCEQYTKKEIRELLGPIVR